MKGTLIHCSEASATVEMIEEPKEVTITEPDGTTRSFIASTKKRTQISSHTLVYPL